MLDTTTNFIEHPELIAQRLQRFVDTVGAERGIAGSACGFGTFAGFGAVDSDIVYAKLAALREGADRVALLRRSRRASSGWQCVLISETPASAGSRRGLCRPSGP